MTYLIYEHGEFMDVINFDTQEEVDVYKSINPSHKLELADENSLLFDEEEEEDFSEDEFSTW